MAVHLLDHPLAAHRLSELRATSTGRERFRHLLDELAAMLAYEATRTLATEAVIVDTPLGVSDARRLTEPAPLVVPILRAGLGMLDATIRMVPTATVALLGLRRDEVTLQPSLYADTVPDDLGGGAVFLLDPMLATGGSAVLAVAHVRARRAGAVHLLSVIAAPEGVAHVQANCADAEIWIAAIDPKLDASGYIHPGLGDAGDRLYGELS